MYLFARAESRAVACNIFLDGNTFGASPSEDYKPIVAGLSVDALENYKNTTFTYARVSCTGEFVGQGESQIFSSVSVNFAP